LHLVDEDEAAEFSAGLKKQSRRYAGIERVVLARSIR
jgi:hypothetical protein